MRGAFRAAVTACTHLRDHLSPGLGAIRRADRQRLRPVNSRRISGSVDVDKALSAPLPNAARWDYAVGYRHAAHAHDTVHWVEVHQANDHGIGEVERKLDWLRGWLTRHAKGLGRLESRFVWVSSGDTRLSPAAPGLKRLAQKGCRHVGRCYQFG